MKAPLLFIAVVLSGTLQGADAPNTGPRTDLPAPPPRLSSETSEQVIEALPKYSPPPPVLAKPKSESDGEVVELPKLTVTQKKRPRLTPEIVLTSKGLDQKMAKSKFGSFDRDFLNRFTLPLFGISPEARAREEYEREKKAELTSDVLAIANATEQVDPEQAKALRDAIKKP
jgi:hypothetical protein